MGLFPFKKKKCLLNLENVNSESAIDKILQSFQRFYTVKKEDVCESFCAEAEFHSHNEQYVLVKAARIASMDTNDYVYFAAEKNLDEPRFSFLKNKAWDNGISKVVPCSTHRNSDVTLVIAADKIDENVKDLIRKTRLYKSYKFSLWGFSNFRLIAMELSSGNFFYNRHGSNLKGTLSSVFAG